jgi:hypothetical protein
MDGRSAGTSPEVTRIAPNRGVALTLEEHESLRPIGWTPDGRRFAYQLWHEALQATVTHVLDIGTGDEVQLRVANGRISNGGDRIVGFDGRGRDRQLCVAKLTGGPCVPIGSPSPNPEHGAGLQWSPDDRFILVQGQGINALILDPEGRKIEQPSWLEAGGESWQRIR